MSPDISEDPLALIRSEERGGPCHFSDIPRSHGHQRQRNHQRRPGASSRSTPLQLEFMGIECVALQAVQRGTLLLTG